MPSTEIQIQSVPLAQLHPNPKNPRHDLGDLTELASSLKALGVQEPLQARPLAGHAGEYEVLSGHRRLAAAKKAGLAEVPVIVRQLDDRQALEAALVANVQRKDIDAISEGEALRELHEDHGIPVPELAAKVGKSPGHVYGRLKLAAGLCKEARAAVHAGLSAQIGLLLARISGQDLQREALGIVTGKEEDPSGPYRHNREVMSYREAQDFIHRRYTLALGNAPFDTKDADLVRAAGACTKCPKRSGNQPELFSDIKGKDLCTDPSCFASKKDAAWIAEKAKAEAKGLKVLDDKEGKEIDRWQAPYVRGSEQIEGSSTTYAQAAERAGIAPSIARTDRGEVVKVFDRKEVLKTRPQPKKKTSPARSSSSGSSGSYQPAGDSIATLIRLETGRRALRAVVAAAEAKAPDAHFWDFIVEYIFGIGDDEGVLERRLGRECYDLRDKAAQKYVTGLTDAQLRGLIIEGIASPAIGSPYASGNSREALALLKWAKVDGKAIEKGVAALTSVAAKAPPATAGTCQICKCTEEKACAGGCGWLNTKRTVCTSHDVKAIEAFIASKVAAAPAKKPAIKKASGPLARKQKGSKKKVAV